MGIYVCEVYLECDDTTPPESYATDCLGFTPNEVVPFYTDDADDPHCQFKDDKSQTQKIYMFIDWGNWRKVHSTPSIVPCPEPDEPDGPRPPEPPDDDDIGGGPIERALCFQKIQQWQRNPSTSVRFGISGDEKTFLRSLETVGSSKLRSALSKQRSGLRGGVGTRFLNSFRIVVVKATINLLLKERGYEDITFARKGSRVALCFTTATGGIHFVTGNGYRKLLKELALGIR